MWSEIPRKFSMLLNNVSFVPIMAICDESVLASLLSFSMFQLDSGGSLKIIKLRKTYCYITVFGLARRHKFT
jgi:hypothetical protein